MMNMYHIAKILIQPIYCDTIESPSVYCHYTFWISVNIEMVCSVVSLMELDLLLSLSFLEDTTTLMLEIVSEPVSETQHCRFS